MKPSSQKAEIFFANGPACMNVVCLCAEVRKSEGRSGIAMGYENEQSDDV